MGINCRLCKSTGLGLFSFPTDPHLRKEWIKSTGLNLDLEAIPKEKLKQFRICYKHFKESDVFFNERRQKYDKKEGKIITLNFFCKNIV